MALTKITKTGINDDAVDSNKIEADSINATKIADNSISEEHIDVTAITGHTELSATAADDDVLIVYDTSAGTIKKIQRSNIALSAPTFSSVSPTSLLSGDGTGNHTIVITGSKFDASATFNLITDGGTAIAMDSVVRNSPTQLTGTVAKNTANLTNANEPFDVKIVNGSGLAVITENQINIDASPAYITAAGTLGTRAGGTAMATIDVVASDPESAGNVTYEIQSGSLPAGVSTATVHENGVSKFRITGTPTNPGGSTTSNFVLRAVDAASNTTSRAFAITVTRTATYTSFTASGTFSVPAGLSNIEEVLVVGGGGHGGYQHSGGGGAGGLIFMPDYPVTPGGTVTVTVGCGGTPSGGSAPGYPNMTGQDSVFGTLTAKGGGVGQSGCSAGPNGDGPTTAGGGGSGGGAGYQSSNNGGAAASQPTQPGNSGAYGFGRDGGNSTGSGAQRAGGGGGGAATAGGQSTNANGGNGGNGKAYTISDGTTPVYYAGGGGGSNHGSPSVAGQGGQGGGGTAGAGPIGQNGAPPAGATNAQDGQANKGGGGGSAHYAGQQNTFALAPAGLNQGNGGKGIVIIKY